MTRDKIDESIFPAAAREYTKYKDIRCALPMLADTYDELREAAFVFYTDSV